jgi:AmmeMemoRadiSam system protein B
MPKVRRATVAGTFYEGKANALEEQIENCFLDEFGPRRVPNVSESRVQNIIGVICPHAGYMYSGPVAAHAYSKLAADGRPDVVVIFGPNHTGCGSGLAASDSDLWRTPLGDVKVDRETIDGIVQKSKIVDVNDSAHASEHSIEVQLPFLQYIYGSTFKIAPICFLMQDLTSSREVGQATAEVLSGKNGIIIASSDMTHYEPRDIAIRKDKLVLDAIEAMDDARLYDVIESAGVTACGFGPIAALISAARALGGKEAKLLCYKTSGDVTGDYSSVVGYAAVAFMK